MTEYIFWSDDAREVADLERMECHAGEELFGEWEKVPDDAKQIINRQKGLPCDGGGMPGHWCSRCYWGRVKRG